MPSCDDGLEARSLRIVWPPDFSRKKTMRTGVSRFACIAVLFTAGVASALAKTYPSKPIRVVIAQAPGSADRSDQPRSSATSSAKASASRSSSMRGPGSGRNSRAPKSRHAPRPTAIRSSWPTIHSPFQSGDLQQAAVRRREQAHADRIAASVPPYTLIRIRHCPSRP